VTFDIDANGIVNVSARDKGTGKEQRVQIRSSGGLSDKDIEQMLKDAERHAADDGKRKERVELKNRADTSIYQTEKNLMEHKDKLGKEDIDAIQADITALKTAAEKVRQRARARATRTHRTRPSARASAHARPPCALCRPLRLRADRRRRPSPRSRSPTSSRRSSRPRSRRSRSRR
jgi:molecular chaperone DnaK